MKENCSVAATKVVYLKILKIVLIFFVTFYIFNKSENYTAKASNYWFGNNLEIMIIDIHLMVWFDPIEMLHSRKKSFQIDYCFTV